MGRSGRWVVAAVIVAVAAGSARAQEPPGPAAPPPATGAVPWSPQNPPPPPPPPPPDPQAPTFRESVVVSASKTEQQLVDAPATMTVIGAGQLSLAPSGGYGDLLRNVPGLNITQISARDINVTSRSATSSLATSQLAVVDGRSLYQDFFGFTMWDFMPANLNEIKRIEVIRGPASAVWGANALNGVINVITKTPREMAGTGVTLGFGGFGREVSGNGASGESLWYLRGTHAEAVNDRWSYKISAGGYSSGPFARPVGQIPNGTGTPYPSYANTGTSQPKLDVRVDYDFPDRRRTLQITGGVAGTDGVMHSGIGPFDIDTGTVLGYWKLNFTRDTFRLQAFMNVLNGQAANFLSIDTTGTPIQFDFDTRTLDVELGDTRLVANKHVLTYGGNLRRNDFTLTIAPGEDGRTEGGAYIQDEFLLNDRIHLSAGARIDKFSSIDKAVFSPRLAAVFKPRADQSVRVSYNRAFRAPSAVNNNLDITIATGLPLAAIGLPLPPPLDTTTFLVPTRALGNRDLTEEHIDAFEVAFTGNIRNRATVSAAWYYSQWGDQILFTQTGEWGPFGPPPGWPLPGLVWAGLYANGIRFPSEFTYLNLGKVRDTGIELGIDGAITDRWGAFVNYAYRAEPDPDFPNLTDEQARAEINLPAQHLLNLGVSYQSPVWYGTFTVSHTTDAFWQDVLDARFHGFTDPYTMVNLTVGRKWQNGRYATALKVVNLANQEIQQHIFGDVLKRQVVGELAVWVGR
ncbi:MAG TPA: TonB-dependent receptor [Vicinamibacterales bacterium]|nr:TonB-dependent receptor [Vicinamibacterales bacterium]